MFIKYVKRKRKETMVLQVRKIKGTANVYIFPLVLHRRISLIVFWNSILYVMPFVPLHFFSSLTNHNRKLYALRNQTNKISVGYAIG